MDKKGVATAIVLAVIFGISTLGLGSFVVYENVLNKPATPSDSSSAVSDDNQSTNDTKTNVTREDESKELVYDLVTEENLKLPYININSSYAKSINKSIEAGKDKRFLTNKTVNGITEGGNADKVDYSYYTNNNILSVVIKSYYASDYDFYEVYNIDVNTGMPVSNLEIINSKNLSIEDFESSAKIKVNAFIEKVTGLKADNEENVSSIRFDLFNKQMYLDADGKINIITYIHHIAGGLGLHEEAITITD